MKQPLLITLLARSHGPAYVEWVSIYITNNVNIYINPETFRRNGECDEVVGIKGLQDCTNRYG